LIRVIKITIVGMDLHDVAVVAEPEPIRSALSDELRVGQAVGNHDKAAFGKGDATHTSAFHVHRRCQLGRWETPGWHTGLQAQSRCGEIALCWERFACISPRHLPRSSEPDVRP
jgi:hypothetical protein